MIGLFLLGLYTSCNFKNEKVKEAPFIPNTGQIQILNGSGVSGVAEDMRNFLTEKGFDVVEFGNADSWNYPQTLIIARTKNTAVARDIAKLLDTPNWFPLLDSSYLVEATVIVGQDYFNLLKSL